MYDCLRQHPNGEVALLSKEDRVITTANSTLQGCKDWSWSIMYVYLD